MAQIKGGGSGSGGLTHVHALDGQLDQHHRRSSVDCVNPFSVHLPNLHDLASRNAKQKEKKRKKGGHKLELS